MATKSTVISTRNANAEFVISSLEAHGSAVAESLLAHNAVLPKKERIQKEQLESTMSWLGAILLHQNEILAAAEMAYVKEQADEPAAMKRRDEHAELLVDVTVRVRGRVESFLGDTGLRTYGMSNPVPRTPQDLAEYVRVAAELMRAHPQIVHDDIAGTLDIVQLAGMLDTHRQPLDEALIALNQERRERTAAMVKRNQVLEEWTTTYQGVAAALAGLYRMAGHDELAQRIRPTNRRTRGNDNTLAPVDSLPGIPEAPAVEAPESAA